MTRSNGYQSQLDAQAESELVKRLANQANRVTVSPQLLSGVEQRHRSILRRRRTVSRVALAGSVVGVVVLAFGLLQLGGSASDSEVLYPAATPDSLSDLLLRPPDGPAAGLENDLVPETCIQAAPAVVSDGELVVWLDVGAHVEVVEQLSAKLSASSAVAAFDYVDHGETYDEFSLYFADEPEVIELVEPEQLPTSFRVQLVEETQAATFVATWAGLDGVDEVELGGETCLDPVAGD